MMMMMMMMMEMWTWEMLFRDDASLTNHYLRFVYNYLYNRMSVCCTIEGEIKKMANAALQNLKHGICWYLIVVGITMYIDLVTTNFEKVKYLV